MPTTKTRPRANQVLFRSPHTGDHTLDVYLTEAQIAGRDLGELLGQIFSGVDGKPIILKWRGEWQQATQYFVNDVVRSGHVWLIATEDHVSGVAVGVEFSSIVDYTSIAQHVTEKADDAGVSADNAFASELAASGSAIAASGSASTALGHAIKAAEWAEKDTEVEPGQFSAKYWAAIAQSFATGATVTVSATEPVDPAEGDIWFDTGVDSAFIWNGAWLPAVVVAATDVVGLDALLDGKDNAWNETAAAVSKTLADNEWVVVTSATQTIALPATPTRGVRVRISVGDFVDTLIGRNGSTIFGNADDYTINKPFVTITAIFDGSTWGIY